MNFLLETEFFCLLHRVIICLGKHLGPILKYDTKQIDFKIVGYSFDSENSMLGREISYFLLLSNIHEILIKNCVIKFKLLTAQGL